MDVKRLKARRDAAQGERDQFQPLLDEAYDYSIPFRRSTKNTGKGEKRVDRVYDHTAIDGAFRFAGKVQQDFWPAGEQNFQIEPGPLVVDPAEKDRLTKTLSVFSSVAQAFFDDDWDMAFHEMCMDLSAGTGAILMNSSPDPEKLWEPISVSIDELTLEGGPNNKISGIFWKRKMTVRVLFETWPEGNFGYNLKELERTKPGDEIEVNTDTIWDPKRKRWMMHVWSDKQEGVIHTSESRTCPWLTPRYFRVPGETMGRGVTMLAMPTIKTANTTARLQLMAAAIAMLGIYTAVDDGVFNPDLATVTPGAFWKVARNGGALGPSISKFPDPRLDLSGMVLNELRMGVKATMMDQSLPPDGAAVRSATEILERVKRLASDHLGAYGRLIKEITIPAVKRVLELAYNKGLLPNEISIDQLLIRVRVKSPLAIAKEAQKVERVIQWLQMVLAIYGAMGTPGRIERVARVDEALISAARAIGVPEDNIVDEETRKALIARDEQERQAMVQAQMAAAAVAGAQGAGA